VIRPDEDLEPQRAAVAHARADLHAALQQLTDAAARASKSARSKSARIDLLPVYSADQAVRRAEEGLDTAVYDLRTASGEDG
jgi:hypothetical protein